jgi:hypothetical protein
MKNKSYSGYHIAKWLCDKFTGNAIGFLSSGNVFIEIQAEILMPQTNRIERRKTNRFVILNDAKRGSNGFRGSFSEVKRMIPATSSMVFILRTRFKNHSRNIRKDALRIDYYYSIIKVPATPPSLSHTS